MRLNVNTRYWSILDCYENADAKSGCSGRTPSANPKCRRSVRSVRADSDPVDAQPKCPVCGKALATRRCITRHVRRAHHGVKESARDKICQQCGKAFRDKKGLREHEFIHTGERPLSCEICGCTFRQSASLYTHRKRVHKIYPRRRNVELLDTAQQGADS